jgi:hypothetical protein
MSVNLAGLFAQVAVRREFDVEAAISPRFLNVRSLEGIRADEALVYFRDAVAEGDAIDLAALVTPISIDQWVEKWEPALLRVDISEYLPMQASLRRVGRDHPAAQRLLATRYLEARPVGGSMVISPQDDDPDRLTVDLLMPTEVPDGIGLTPVSAPMLGGRWNQVATELRERPGEASAEQAEASKCREAIVPGPRGRWVSGCARGDCEGTCTAVEVPGENGIDSFGCVCGTDQEEDTSAAAGEIGTRRGFP